MGIEEKVDRAIDERYRKRFGETLHEEPRMLEPIESGHITPMPVGAGKPVMLEPVKPRTRATVAGILLIVAGMLSIITWAYSIFLGFPLISIESNTMIVFAIVGSVFALFAVIAGVMASIGKNWKTCVFFSLLGILSIGFLVSSILCIVAFIVLLMSKKEFI